MARQLMIYERAVPLSSQAHRDWSVKFDGTFAFSKEVNSVPILAAEFAACAMEYTIVFAGDGGGVFPSVILGMRDGENQHLNADGTWAGRSVPAFLRRYPFVFAVSDDNATFTLCIDEEFEGLNRDGEGERLFDSKGNCTQYLENTLKFATEYQAQFRRTQIFAQKLAELDLLEPAQAQFSLATGERMHLGGFKTISRDRLKALAPDKLAALAQTDELELCYLHLHSLNNITPMTERVAQRLQKDAAE